MTLSTVHQGFPDTFRYGTPEIYRYRTGITYRFFFLQKGLQEYRYTVNYLARNISQVTCKCL
jgi:hypothetical protein